MDEVLIQAKVGPFSITILGRAHDREVEELMLNYGEKEHLFSSGQVFGRWKQMEINEMDLIVTLASKDDPDEVSGQFQIFF